MNKESLAPMPALPVSSSRPNDSGVQALEHIHFQLSLLRLTAVPLKCRGAEAKGLSEPEFDSAESLIEEMAVAATRGV